MRKYLTQHLLKVYTLHLPKHALLNGELGVENNEEYAVGVERQLINRIIKFLQPHSENDYKRLPRFNFLANFYELVVVESNKDEIILDLYLDKNLNKSIWLRLKHTIFNQYNTLIGFSEILKDVEDIEDSERFLISKFNENARDLFSNTKLLMEFEQLRDLDFEIVTNLIEPLEFLSSYLTHRNNGKSSILTDYDKHELNGVGLKIGHELFKNTLNILLDNVEDAIGFNQAKFQIKVKEKCHFVFESDIIAQNEFDLKGEIETFDDFYIRGKDISYTSERVFKLFYIRLIAEKLGGEFNICIEQDPAMKLTAEWIFPIVKTEKIKIESVENNLLEIKETESKPHEFHYSNGMIEELKIDFSAVKGSFVLDDWSEFADKLYRIRIKNSHIEGHELKDIEGGIRNAIDKFDVTALKKIASRIGLLILK